MLELLEKGLAKIGSIANKITLISIINSFLFLGAVLAIIYVLSINMENKKDGKVLKEGFVSSPHYPDAHTSLLLDSIYERDRSGVFKTFKNQITNLPTSCMGEYKQKQIILWSRVCGGKDTNPNMCLYSKVKKKFKTKRKKL